MLDQITGFTTKELFGLSVLGALVTTTGTMIGLILKELVFARSFEKWKARLTLEILYQKYRDPLILAADEFGIRLKEVCEGYGAEYLASSLLSQTPSQMRVAWADDPYYRRYKLESTIYRLCALLGWFELYRQEVVFLRSGRAKHNRELEDSIIGIREVLADGQLNAEPDWEDWRDRLVFREEQ